VGVVDLSLLADALQIYHLGQQLLTADFDDLSSSSRTFEVLCPLDSTQMQRGRNQTGELIQRVQFWSLRSMADRQQLDIPSPKVQEDVAGSCCSRLSLARAFEQRRSSSGQFGIPGL